MVCNESLEIRLVKTFDPGQVNCKNTVENLLEGVGLILI